MKKYIMKFEEWKKSLFKVHFFKDVFIKIVSSLV